MTVFFHDYLPLNNVQGFNGLFFINIVRYTCEYLLKIYPQVLHNTCIVLSMFSAPSVHKIFQLKNRL